MIAEVLHFYGFSWEELLNLSFSWFCILYGQIPVVEARRLLATLPVLTYPHLITKKDRESVYRRLTRLSGYAAMRHRFTTAETVAAGWDRLSQMTAQKEPRDGRTD